MIINTVTFQGSALTKLGRELEVGNLAPEFRLVKNDLTEITLRELDGKSCIVNSAINRYPSL